MKAWAIGVDSDQHDEMPGTVLTSMVKRVDVVVYDVVKQVLDGSFAGGLHGFGLKEEGIGYVSEGPHAAMMPDEVRSQVDAIRAQVIAGTIRVLP
jgi:basic membrane protein A